MVKFDVQQQALIGQAGSLAVAENDEIARKLAMLIEGECEGLGPVKAAAKFNYTRQRYHQIRCAFWNRALRHSCPKHVAPSGTTAVPARWCAKSSGIAFSIRMRRLKSLPKSCGSRDGRSAPAVLNASSASTAFKKKLYKCRPRGDGEKPDFAVEDFTRARTKPADCDPLSIQRGVRQMLADKVSGHLVGVWLLVAEELRLGTWDLFVLGPGEPPSVSSHAWPYS